MAKVINVHDDPAYKGCPSTKLPNLKDARIDRDSLQLIELIGYGSWATVYKAKCIKAGRRYNYDQFYAVKCMIPRRFSPWQQKAVAEEVRLHKRCAAASSSILKVVNVIDEDETTGLLYIVTEYCEGGDLNDFIEQQMKEKTPKDDRRIRKMFVEILDAVEACHQRGVYHRDLKPENIFLKKQGRKAVLGDFGLATMNRYTKDFGVGSEPYMAPELLTRSKNPISSPRADVWALGVILVNLITGKYAWAKATRNDRAFDWYAYGNRDALLHILKDISPEVNKILKDVFRCNPSNRMSIPELRYRILRVQSFTRDSDLSFRFLNYRPQRGRFFMQLARPAVNELPGLESDSDSSDSDSDGPETPEMNAMDDEALSLEGMDDLNLGSDPAAREVARNVFRIVRVTTREEIKSKGRRLKKVSKYFAARGQS